MKKSHYLKSMFAIVLVIAFVLNVSLLNVKADTISDAKTMTYGTKYSGSVSYNGQRFYKISLPKSGLINYNLTSTDAQVQIKIYSNYDLDTPVHESSTQYNSNLGYYVKKNTVPLLAGVYYIRIRNVKSTTAGFSIKATYASSKESYTESFKNHYDVIGTAKTIAINKTYKGMLFDSVSGNSDGVDMYKVNLKSAKTLKFTSKSIKTDGSVVYFSVIDKNGNDVTKSVTGKSDHRLNPEKNTTYSFTGKFKKGTYYIKIYKYTGMYYRNYIFYSLKYTSV